MILYSTIFFQNTNVESLITNAKTAVICPNEVTSFENNLPNVIANNNHEVC